MTNQAEVRNVYYVLKENSNLVEKLSETPTPYLAMQDAPYSMTLEQLEKALEIDKILIHNGVIYDKESFVQANAEAIQRQKEETEGVDTSNSYEFVTSKDFHKAIVEMTNLVMQYKGGPDVLGALMSKLKPNPAKPEAGKPDKPETGKPEAPAPVDPKKVDMTDPKVLAAMGITETEVEEEEEEEEDEKGTEESTPGT